MQISEVADLHKRPLYPSVSLIATVPEHDRETVRGALRSQLRTAEARLALEFTAPEVGVLRECLDREIEAIQLDLDVRSIVVYGNQKESTCVALPVAVRERVVIDDTFATRDVVHAILQARQYRVLVLGARNQLFDGTGRILMPTTSGGFPIDVENPPSDEPPRRRERSDVDRRRLRTATRAVDRALDTYLRAQPLPLFVIGVQPRLAWFEHNSSHRGAISASATGAPATIAEVKAIVEPMVDELLDETARDAVGRIDAARSGRRLATGIIETWQLARAGRGALLVVEEGYEYPAVLGHESDDVRPADDAAAPGVVDDLVDEAIETVLARGGLAVIVPDGTLEDCDRICLTLRY